MDVQASLIPGYTQVDEFKHDSDYEDVDGEVVEEVEYITLDLGSVEPTLVPSSSSFRLIGLDTPTPYLQLAGTVFKGEHQSLLGTELLFTDSKDDNTKKTLTHVANTEQRIRFKEVELIPNSKNPAPTTSPTTTTTTNTSSKRPSQAHFFENIVGNPQAPPPKRRRRKSTKAKGKGRARQTEQPEPEPEVEEMDVDTAEV